MCPYPLPVPQCAFCLPVMCLSAIPCPSGLFICLLFGGLYHLADLTTGFLFICPAVHACTDLSFHLPSLCQAPFFWCPPLIVVCPNLPVQTSFLLVRFIGAVPVLFCPLFPCQSVSVCSPGHISLLFTLALLVPKVSLSGLSRPGCQFNSLCEGLVLSSLHALNLVPSLFIFHYWCMHQRELA